ncbi:hypothetical protein AMK15_16180 [Streptomyces sp. MJM1172]|nr:hypothetical protein AMK15_16180 [Streptomyces sp. MJM1172]
MSQFQELARFDTQVWGPLNRTPFPRSGDRTTAVAHASVLRVATELHLLTRDCIAPHMSPREATMSSWSALPWRRRVTMSPSQMAALIMLSPTTGIQRVPGFS